MDLELIDDDTLLNEIKSRFDHVSFAGIKSRYEGPTESRISFRWRGCPYTITGLCRSMIRRMDSIIDNDSKEKE